MYKKCELNLYLKQVQTSRSVSGAHYIPSSSVDQDERRKLLNEPVNVVTEPTVPDNYTVVSSTSTKVKTSTESLIDKLDRVQSDLYSGLLTGKTIEQYKVIKNKMTFG